MSQQTFSRRTVAIAVAAAVTVGAAPAIGTTGPLAAITPTANAQDVTDQKPGVATSDVKYLGVFDKDGTKVTGPFESTRYNNTNNTSGTVLGVDSGYEIRGEFSLANANPGDVLRLSPVTEFSFPNGDTGTTSHSGLRIYQSTEWADVTHEGAVIGQYRTVRSGSIELRFSDAIADVKSGTITLAAPAMVWDAYTSPEKNGYEGDSWDGKGFSNYVDGTTIARATAIPKGGTAETNTVGSIGTTRFATVTSPSMKNRINAYENSALVVDNENFTVRRSDTTVYLPAGANGTITLTPDVDRDHSADWYFTDNLRFEPYVQVYGKTGSDEEYENHNMSYEDAQKAFPGLNITAKQTNRGVVITTDGIPENVKPYVKIRPAEGSNSISNGTYVENASLYYSGEFTGTINGEAATRTIGNILSIMAAIPGQPSVAGLENVKRTGELSGSIAGQPTGLGVDGSVAPVGGTKQTFQFFIKNTGDAPLVAPIVTLPNGKKQAIKGVAIAPNGTGSFSVDYDVPAGNGALNFDVSLSRATLSPSNTVSFRYSVADQADSAAGKITYKEAKAPRGQVTTITPSGVPKGASAARTPDTPAWAEIGQDGKLTLKPDNSASLGRTEIPVKFTFSDGSQTTINPVITVAEEDPSKSTFDPRTQEEKADDAIIDNIEDLNKKVDAQNEELKRQTDELKKQADALNKQADTLKNMQDELDKANKLTEKQNELIGKQTDAINKQTDAVNELTDATEKQTAEVTKRLDTSNKIAKDQLETLNKELAESIKQTREMIRQSAALEKQNQILIDQHKDQLAQWKKENEFAQNEQDDRRHKDNFARCVTSDPATAVLVALPVLSLMVAAGIPYTGHMLEDANKQLTALNDRLGAQVNIPADLQRQIHTFNAENGDLVRVGATTAGALAALAGLVVAINHLVNGCYAEADKSVGREPQAPKTSSESVLSSKPWVQETTAPKTHAEVANQ